MITNVSPSGPVGVSANVPSIHKLGQLMSFQSPVSRGWGDQRTLRLRDAIWDRGYCWLWEWVTVGNNGSLEFRIVERSRVVVV